MPVNLLGGVKNNFLDKVIHNRRGKLGDAYVLSGKGAKLLKVVLSLLVVFNFKLEFGNLFL